MHYDKIITFVTQNPICTLATSTDNIPHNRAFLTNIINNQIHFTTSSHKNVGKELLQNEKIALCYLSADFSTMLRINTSIQIVTDLTLKQKMIDEKEYLRGFKADDETFILFTLSDSKATFWGLENNMKENELETITF